MSGVVIAARDVPRWVQPAPTVTNGEALLLFDVSAQCVVEGMAVAAIPLAPLFPTAVLVEGSATAACQGEVFVFPAAFGLAMVDIDGVSEVEDHLGVANGVAVVLVDAVGEFAAASDGAAYAFFISDTAAVVPQLGDAQIPEWQDYGQGSTPVFPFTLPTQFTDRWSNEQDAFAFVSITGVGHDIGVGGFASASLQFEGSAASSIKGTVSVFPYTLPAVFDDSFYGSVGSAVLAVGSTGHVVVSAVGDAVADIGGASFSLSSSVFPFSFPTLFYQPFQTGVAGIEVAAVGEVSVRTRGQSVVSVAASGITLNLTILPFRLPAMFLDDV